ncbi:SAV_2336 family protein [Streptomyces phaeochromogenes]|uniref:SAV_2336 family protein n=1 Tax=Streptomyces phaeochromogenes TaxID=1923 RepID=A0ABZ1HUL0_STRPH|nr:SAV_2336 N-terminal domain-related protein [Streptomyces phaeochromogenes]WSD21236.1 SAV_2336 family protein [Streptomyces phaeochromogenes]
MIARLREALRAAGYDPEPGELADIIWLATQDLQRQTAPMPATEGGSSAGDVPRRASPPLERQRSRPIETSLRLPPHRTQTLYSTAEGPGGPGLAVTHVRIGTPKALPKLHSLERSLRPLRTTVHSRVRHELDLAATIAAIAEGFPDVALRPARELLLDATLVVDDGASMAIWHDAAYELYQALHRLRAFGRIRLFGLGTDRADDVQLTSEPFRPGAPHASAPAGERHLILVLTDAVGEAWATGAAQRRLEAWARRGPLAVLQVLPQQLWQEVGLPTTQLMVSAPRPAVSNRYLRLRHPRLPRDLLPVPRLAIPVVEAVSGSPASSWARLVVAPAGEAALHVVDLHKVQGNMFDGSTEADHGDGGQTPRELVEDEQSAEQALDDFLGYASQPALRLAAHLACAGSALTIPLMRLIQRSAVPEAGPEHLAEVFLSGLLYPHYPKAADSHGAPNGALPHDSLPWNRRAYAYPPQLLGPLRELVRRSEEQDTLDYVSRYLAHRRASAVAGMALISDPAGVLRASAQALPLARVERPATTRLSEPRIQINLSSDSAEPRLARLLRSTVTESALHEVGLDITRRASTIRVLFPAGRTEPLLLTTLLSSLQRALEQDDAAPGRQSPIRVAMDFNAPGKPLDATLRGVLQSISRHPAYHHRLWVVAASRRLMVELYGPGLEGSDSFRELRVNQKCLYLLNEGAPIEGRPMAEDGESSRTPDPSKASTVHAGAESYADQLVALGADLAALRLACGSPSVREIAQAMASLGEPVGQTTIYSALRGQTLPRRDTFIALVQVLQSFARAGQSVPRHAWGLEEWWNRWHHLAQLKPQSKGSRRSAHSWGHPQVKLIATPDRGVWRLGKSRAPLSYNRYDSDNATAPEPEDRQRGPGPGILYCASTAEGCFSQALAPFRVDPQLRSVLDEERKTDLSLLPIGTLPQDWRTRHVLVRVQVPPDARFLDISDAHTLQYLDRLLHTDLRSRGIQDLTLQQTRGFNRRITQRLSEWAHELLAPNGERLHGIAFRTPRHRYWGIFEGMEVREVERQPVSPETDALARVAAEFGLTVL